MIVAEQKPLDEIKTLVGNARNVLVVGCGTCVTVCFAGGSREAAILSASLRMATKLEGSPKAVSDVTVQRQCEWEYLDPIADQIKDADIVLSLGADFLTFGPGNLRPVFLSRNLEVYGTPRIVGRNHLRMKVRQNGAIFDAIAFGMGDRLRDIMGRRDLQLVYTVEENDWSPNGEARPGETTPQLKIKDLR